MDHDQSGGRVAAEGAIFARTSFDIPLKIGNPAFPYHAAAKATIRNERLSTAMKIKNTLAELFGKSPIRPIQEHMEVSASAADRVSAFFDAVVASNWERAEALYAQIREIENRADHLKKDLRLHLPKSLFLPVPRGDLLDLLTKQDKIANTAKDIAGLMLGRKMVIPPPLQASFKSFIAMAIASVHQALKAIEELDELLESGFSGRELLVVERIVEELDNLERQVDEQEVHIRGELFHLEAGLPPVDVMFIYKVIEAIGELADRSQGVGGRLILLLAR